METAKPSRKISLTIIVIIIAINNIIWWWRCWCWYFHNDGHIFSPVWTTLEVFFFFFNDALPRHPWILHPSSPQSAPLLTFRRSAVSCVEQVGSWQNRSCRLNVFLEISSEETSVVSEQTNVRFSSSKGNHETCQCYLRPGEWHCSFAAWELPKKREQPPQQNTPPLTGINK